MPRTQPDVRKLVHSPAQLSQEYVKWVESIHNSPGVPFGIPAVDKIVLPLRPGRMAVFCGRPGSGKSTCLVFLARQEAKRIKARGKQEEECVVFVTWEQVTEEITAMMQVTTSYSVTDVMWGRVSTEKVKKQVVQQGLLPVWMIGESLESGLNTPRMFPDNVFDAIESIRTEDGRRPTLMCFDYIQLIPIPRQTDRFKQVAEATIRCKEMAKRLACPVAVAVQARQEVDDRAIKIPTLRDGQHSCVAGDTELINAKTGEVITATALWNMWKTQIVGCFPIHSFVKNEYALRSDWIVAAKQNPPEQIYRLSCGNAGSIRTNNTHQFLTPAGFQCLSELQVGDWIAFAKHLPIDIDKSEISKERAYILGLLLGDGCVRKSLILTNTDKEILASFRDAVEKEWPSYTTRERKRLTKEAYDSTIRRCDGRVFPNGNVAVSWAREVGLLGQKAADKHVPNLRLGTAEVSALLSGLFSADGSLSFWANRPKIGFHSCSKRLVKDVKWLLQRIGIASTIRLQRVAPGRPMWHLQVISTDLRQFAKYINMRGRKGNRLRQFMEENPNFRGRSMGDLLPPAWNMDSINVLKQHHLRTKFSNGKGQAITRGRMAQIAKATGNPTLFAYANSELWWRKITTIEPDGIEHTYDFCVPDRETFVANGFVVHNSQIGQTTDDFFGLWRPWITEPHHSFITVAGQELEVTQELLILAMCKQRFAEPSHIWPLYFQPQWLRLCAMETAIEDRFLGRSG